MAPYLHSTSAPCGECFRSPCLLVNFKPRQTHDEVEQSFCGWSFTYLHEPEGTYDD